MVTQQDVNHRGMSCRGRITICIENAENVVSTMLVFNLLYKVFYGMEYLDNSVRNAIHHL